MNDYELEQGLRAFFRDEVGHDEVAPARLHAALAEIAQERAAASLFGTRRGLVLVAAVVMLTVAAIGTALLLMQPRPPLPLPLAPPVINLWMVIQNERSTPIDYTMSGGDASGGSVIGCTVGLSSNVMTEPWSLEMDGKTILTSDDGAAAYQGLASGGDVVIHVTAVEGADLEIAPLEAGTGLGTDDSPPDSCVGYVEPPSNVEVPDEFGGPWRTTVPADLALTHGIYQIYLGQGAVERYARAGHGEAQFIQGAIVSVAGDQITFGPSPVCPAMGKYRFGFTLAHSTLTLTAIDDTCRQRLALFTFNALELHPDLGLQGGVRYIARDFQPPVAFTAPPEMDFPGDGESGYNASRASSHYYYRVPGLGWEIHEYSNTTPAGCNGPEDWLTGERASFDAFEEPRIIRSLDAFRDAFITWDADHPDVRITAPRDISIAGRPATMIDVVATKPCDGEPGLGRGDTLERTFAIDIGDRLLIIATGPGVFGADWMVDPNLHEAQTYDPALLDVGERFARSIELL